MMALLSELIFLKVGSDYRNSGGPPAEFQVICGSTIEFNVLTNARKYRARQGFLIRPAEATVLPSHPFLNSIGRLKYQTQLLITNYICL